MNVPVITPKKSYDAQNEGAFREEVRRKLAGSYDRRGDVVVPFGKRLAFTSAQGQTIFFGYNADGDFTIQQDTSTPFGLASLSYVSTVQSDLESSFASLETSLTADFGDLEASFTTIATAFADIETAFATLEVDVEAANDAAAAAATSALAAYASETAAGSSAAAAATSATNASTSASNASTSASQASTSETNAAGSAATATTQASNAATSATNAGNSATAASGSASTASTQATNAANSASAANTSATSAATQASNAATSASAASTSAGAASTSASQASTSESNAAGSAAAASTSASAAAGSATSAGNSATAASTSASTASTHATNAGTSASNASTSASNAATSASAAGSSASAASTSASSASTSASNAATSASAAQSNLVAVKVTAAALFPSTFERDGAFFTDDAGTFEPAELSATFADVAGVGRVVRSTGYDHRLQRGLMTPVAGRTYRISARTRVLTDATNGYPPAFLLGIWYWQNPSTYLGAAGWFDSFLTKTAADGWFTQTGTFTLADLHAVNSNISMVRAGVVPCWNATSASNAVAETAFIRLEDITESTSAAGSASAASSSASSAAASQSAAASSASAASTSATNAATQASNAATSASNASTSETNAAGSASTASTAATAAAASQSAAAGSATAASGSASTASTQAGNAGTSASAAASSATAAAASASSASSSASTATTQASAASASASSASASATLSATFASGSQGSINSSPTFADNANATGIPTHWGGWGASTPTRVTGIAPQPYAVTITGGAGTDDGISQDLSGRMALGWHVIEADITLNSGTLSGAGVYIHWGPSGGIAYGSQLIFWSEPDITAGAPGAGTVGKTYKFRKLVSIHTAAEIFQIFAMTHWSANGSIAVANSITWHRCAIRAASQAEIEARQATTDLVTANANIATNASAIASEAGSRAAETAALTARFVANQKNSQNMLRNSTFRDASQWTFGSSILTGQPYTDHIYAYIGYAGGHRAIYQDVRVEVGARYALSGDIYSDNDNVARIYMQFLNETRTASVGSNYGYREPASYGTQGSGWRRVVFDITNPYEYDSVPGINAPSGAAWARIFLDNHPGTAATAGGTAFRRIKFERGDYATAWAEDDGLVAATEANAVATSASSAAATANASIATTNATVAANYTALRSGGTAEALPSTFDKDDLYWNQVGGSFANHTGVGRVWRAATVGDSVRSRQRIVLRPNRTYRVSARYGVQVNSTSGNNPQPLYGLTTYDAAGTNIAGVWGPSFVDRTTSDGWVTVTAEFTSAAIAAAGPGGGVEMDAYCQPNWHPSGAPNATIDVQFVELKDVTDIVATNATVTTNTSAIATINGAAAFWETIVAAGGGDLAAVRLKAGASGSYLELISTVLRLANVSNGAIIEVMRAVSGEAYFSRPISSDSGSRRVTIGPGYGVSGQEVVLWFGPVATAPASQSRTNGYFALGTDGQVYYGAGALSTVTAYYGTHNGPAVASRTGAGYVSSGAVTITPVNGTAPFYYRYTMLENPNSISLNATNGVGNNTFSINATISAAAIWRCNVAVDITDAIGRTTRVIVSDNELYDDT